MSGQTFTPLLRSVGGALARGRYLPSGRSGGWEEVAVKPHDISSDMGVAVKPRNISPNVGVAVKPRNISPDVGVAVKPHDI